MRQAGIDDTRLQRIIESIQHDVDSGFYDGAQIAVGRHGHLVLDEAVGYAEPKTQRPLKQEDILVPFSISKQLVVAVVLLYVERGLLLLAQPVAEILPAFGGWGQAHRCSGSNRTATCASS